MNQNKASKMAVFTNGGVLAGLKISHFRGLTVLCEFVSQGAFEIPLVQVMTFRLHLIKRAF